MSKEILKIEDLYVEYLADDERVFAVNGIDLSLSKGETLGLVGETGAGKTSLAKSIMGILPDGIGSITNGRILFEGIELTKFSEKELLDIRGNKISMIFQDPLTSLNPSITVDKQIAEVLKIHHNQSNEELNKRVRELFELVGIPKIRLKEYPHQFSGGMKQRVVIAMALACNPEVIIADEPTTALDVTIQAQVLQMMRDLKNKFNTAMIMITHDLGVVAEICDRVAIMYAGEIVESGTIEDIFLHPSHPYTVGLLNSVPNLEIKIDRLKPVPGLMPDSKKLPSGCKFHPRCFKAINECSRTSPNIINNKGHLVKCLLYSVEAN